MGKGHRSAVIDSSERLIYSVAEVAQLLGISEWERVPGH